MLPPFARNIGWFRTALALIILISGLVCAGIDMVHNHANVVAGSKCQNDADTCAQHMVALESADGPPCNACFLHKLLTQALLPARPCAAADVRPLKPADAHDAPELASYYVDRVTRGPPRI